MSRILCSAFFMFLAISTPVKSAPYHGNIVRLLQPDGSKISVRVYGDEYYQRIESLDGYTLTRNPRDGWISYATLSSQGDDFEASGERYLGNLHSPKNTSRNLNRPATPTQLSLPKHRIRAIAQENRRLLGVVSKNRHDQSATTLYANPKTRAATLGSVVGLTLLIEFPDAPADFMSEEIDAYLNSYGYSRFGNNGSVHEYFRDISDGLLNYTNVITPYYMAKNPKSYYTDPDVSFGVRARELIQEALHALQKQGFDFSQVSANASDEFQALNVFYVGDVDTGWSKGLWPHMGYMNTEVDNVGLSVGAYQITNMGNELTIGTFCHENGHLLMNWPDLYDQDLGYGSTGIGSYGLMAGGSLVAGGRNPVPPNPYYRTIAGWTWAEDINGSAPGSEFSLVANDHKAYRFINPNYSSESFYIEARTKTGRSAELPDEGLLIWHIDTQGNNRFDQMTSEQHFMISVEQADGNFDLENERGAGAGDLFHGGYADRFTPNTVPNSNWWDGSDSYLSIENISDVGSIMSFSMNTPVDEPVNRCEFVIHSEWQTGLVASIRVTNNRSTPVQSWDIQWQFDNGHTVVNAWNATVSGSNPYSAQSLSWNAGIAAGQTVEVGMLISKSDNGTPAGVPHISGAVCN